MPTVQASLLESPESTGLQAAHAFSNAPTYHPVTLSLFSGAGGLDIGFHKAGFDIVACVEIEKSFCESLKANVGGVLDATCQVINRDIREIIPDEITNTEIDFIIGGPPCQSFSAIGRRAGGVEGIQDKRGSLFEHYCRLVWHYQPRGFLFENVRGILSANKGQDWVEIRKAFSDLGYDLAYRVLDCAAYGVPQHRERLIMIGTRNGKARFPQPTHGPDSPDGKPFVSAFDAISDIQNPTEPHHTCDGKYGKFLEEVPPGQNYHYFTKEMGHPEPSFAWRSRFSDFLYKADPEKPVRTIVASLGAYSGPWHWKNRKLTIPEFKRLQTFPDDYKLVGGFNIAQKQIGNSVPPLFAERLAEAVLQQVFNVPLGVQLIDDDHRLSFDARKGVKARATRSKRSALVNNGEQSSLFLLPDTRQLVPDVEYDDQKLWHYSTMRERSEIASPQGYLTGNIYDVSLTRRGSVSILRVARWTKDTSESACLLRYKILFHHPIGDGLHEIECELFSHTSEDIPIAWDAIEDCLSRSSGYSTMMDVYGHFTEPHPSFDLTMDVLTSSPDFVLRFAKYFSSFETTTKILPASVLRGLYGESPDAFDLQTVVKALRNYRFDVRVNETNPTIPIGYFRCCYPFTIHVNKQISVVWKDSMRKRKSNDVALESSAYWLKLSAAYEQAQALIAADDPEAAITDFKEQMGLTAPLQEQAGGNKTADLAISVGAGLDSIVRNIGSNKYLYSVFITACSEKLVSPEQDIRRIQAESMADGYSNRSVDQTYVTPFLKRQGLTHCAASGVESGRNVERGIPLDFNHSLRPQGKGNREVILGLFHAVEVQQIDPSACMAVLFARDMQREQKAIYQYHEPKGKTVQEIINAVMDHYQRATGKGKSRLPVLAIHSVYHCLVNEMGRYKGKSLLPIDRHTGNDKKGRVGDVQINNDADNTPFEAVEIKSAISIKAEMVRKVLNFTADRYYILSTEPEYIKADESEAVKAAVALVRQTTGCEVIVNGMPRSLWYYLRLLSNPAQFIEQYTKAVEVDQDIQDSHRALWAEILEKMVEGESQV